jgi:hypothetical protein
MIKYGEEFECRRWGGGGEEKITKEKEMGVREGTQRERRKKACQLHLCLLQIKN